MHGWGRAGSGDCALVVISALIWWCVVLFLNRAVTVFASLLALRDQNPSFVSLYQPFLTQSSRPEISKRASRPIWSAAAVGRRWSGKVLVGDGGVKTVSKQSRLQQSRLRFHYFEVRIEQNGVFSLVLPVYFWSR